MNQLDGALKTFKHFEIADEQAKIQDYRFAYEAIHENYTVTIAKNFASKAIQIIVLLLSISFLCLGVYVFAPGTLGKMFINIDSEEQSNVMRVLLGGCLFIMCLLAFFLQLSIRKNRQRRNLISDLSVLLEEVIEHAEYSVADKTKRYEMYVENLHRNQK